MRELDDAASEHSALLGSHTDTAGQKISAADDRPVVVDAFLSHARRQRTTLAMTLIVGWMLNVASVAALASSSAVRHLYGLQTVCDGLGLAFKVSAPPRPCLP